MTHGAWRGPRLTGSAWPNSTSGVLAAAGPWDDDSGAPLIFRLDEPGARAGIDADPYYTAPGVRIVAIRAWTPVVGA